MGLSPILHSARARPNMFVIAAAFGIFSLSLLFQGKRWASTPAYHDILAIMPQSAWGGIFAGVTVLLAGAVRCPHWRWLAVTALTAAFMVTTCWALAFVVRWLTSPNTTPETWVSWMVFDYVLIRAAGLLDYREVKIPRDGIPPDD